MNRKNISWMMIIVFTVIIIGSQFVPFKQVSIAAMDKLKWRKNDTLDISMNVVGNKTGIDDILLECDLENAGTYVLDYYLEDLRKTEVIIEQSYDKVDIYYKVLENQGDPLNPVNITQNLLDISYLEVDYSLEVPDWIYDGGKLVDADPNGEDAIKFTVPRSASAKYPGVAFNVNNKRVIIKWDFQTDKLYYLMTGYEAGKVMPITYTMPDGGNESLKALKSLEDFNVNPRYLKNNAGTNEEVTPILSPDLDGDGIVDSPGARPALEITFKQPKEFNPATWVYDNAGTNYEDISAYFEIADIASDDYMDFNFELATSANNEINSLPNEDLDNNGTNDNENVTYSYAAGTYTILISKDKRDLANQDTIIQWNDLAGSKIYNVDVNFQVSAGFDNYQFTSYNPVNKFAYTYMEYELKRANMQEAYLDIKPYDVGAQDEVEYTILYSKVVKPVLDPEDDLWVKHYHTGEDSSDNIFVPVPFRSTSSQDVYQIIVNFANTEIVSQVLNYRANLDTDVPPTTPTIDSIENLYVVPPDDDSVDPLKIQFDLTWTAPSNRIVTELDNVFENIDGNADNDRIYYEVMINDLPNGTGDNPYDTIKVFEVYKDVDDLYKIKLHDDTTGSGEPATTNFTHGYNNIDELFRMNKINIYSNDQWSKKITTVVDEVGGTYTVTETADDPDILFPGVNYIRMRAITMTDGVIDTSYQSVPVSLSLSMIKYEIPLVDNLSYLPLYGANDSDPLGVSLYWDSIDIDNYENHMLYPIYKEVDSNVDSIIYSVYISEDRQKIANLENTDDNYINIPMEANDTVVIDNTVADPELNDLRNGEVLYFELPTGKDTNTTLNVDIEGLDKNNNYYVRVVTKLLVNDLVGADNEERRSMASSMLSLITPVFPKPPGDDEIYPLAPNGLEAAFIDDNRLSASLTWNMPDSMTLEQDTYGFEIFSMENRSLPTNLSSRDTSIDDILADPSLDTEIKEAWKIYVEGGIAVLKKYNEDTDNWDVLDDSLLNVDLPVISMIDSSNSPNKVNYYYVRSINVEGGNTKAASAWASDTITTSPVKQPINLVVDYSDTYPNDAKNEAIIRFDAPIPDTASLGTDYVIEIYVKGEKDTDYSLTKYPSTYLDEVEGAVGHRRLYYRINSLESGKKYNIKVRIEDRTKPVETLPNGSTEYPKSPYSVIVSTRTEFDQEDYDKENKYFEYIDYYVTKAEDLKKVSYFTLENTSNKHVIKYRDDYAVGELKRASNSEYSLVVKDKTTNIYYLPANFIDTVNANKVTVKIKPRNQIIGIRPFSIGTDITKEIKDMIKIINEYSSSIVDYYIRITINVGEYNGTINNKKPISDLLDIKIEVIGSNKLEENIDLEMVEDLDSVIEANKATLITSLENELDLGINDSKLTKIVQDTINKVKSDYEALANLKMNQSLTTTNYSINNLSKNMFIALSSNDLEQDSDTYIKNQGIWEKVTNNYYSNMYYVDTNKLTSFILLPKTLGSSKIYNMYSNEEVDVINKYKLTEIFSSAELTNKETNIRKYQLISAYARMLGAAGSYDNIDYLLEKGITVNSTNNYLPVNRDEALNTYVQVFALRNNIDLNKVNILNYNIIEDVKDIDNRYKKNLIIGANLGIIELVNGKVEPKQKINMEDTITLLTRIEEGIDW